MTLKIRLYFFTLFILSFYYRAGAQTSTGNGWFFLSHQQQLSKKWDALLDVQLRSSDHIDYLQTLLIRPALSYNFSDHQSTALGYVYFANWKREEGENTFEPEHRVWEQYNLETKTGNISFTNRLRLEQRFLQQDEQHQFAQRLRYYVRMQLPLVNQKEFKKGIYLGLQNEVFLNVQNKNNVNNKFFDQNRVYAGLGYRFSKWVDAEAGYLYRYQIDGEKMYHHILQVMITTEF